MGGALPSSSAPRVPAKKSLSPAADAAISRIFIAAPENFISANPHFAKSALARYTPADFIALVESHAISYHEKTLGQLFCDRAARDITDMLEAECRAAKVDLFLNTAIQEVRYAAEFTVHAAAARIFSSRPRRRHWRTNHPQNGRHRFRLSNRPPVRNKDSPNAPGSHPTSIRKR